MHRRGRAGPLRRRRELVLRAGRPLAGRPLRRFRHLYRVARWFDDEFGFRTDFGFAGQAVEGIVDFELADAFYGDADGDRIPEVAFGRSSSRELDEDRHCPADIYGQSHRDGEVWAAFGWNLIEDELIGANAAAHVIFGALNRWGDEVSWRRAGESVAESADELLDEGFLDGAARGRISELLVTSGFDDCGRVVRLDEGAEPTRLIRAFRRKDGSLRIFPPANQASLDSRELGVALRFYVEELAADVEGDLGWTIYVRRGEHVVFEQQEVDGRMRPLPVEYDFAVEGVGEGLAVELTHDTEPALEPGATYYYAFMGRPTDDDSRVVAEITVRGESEFLDVPDDSDEVEGDGSGCGNCSAAPAPGARPWKALLLLLVPALRRRR